MLANMKAKVYCLHPGKLIVKAVGRDENGQPTDRAVNALKHFSSQDLIKLYGVDPELCVTWGRDCVGVDHLIHLHPNREGSYELPVMGTPERSNRTRKTQR